MSANPVYPYCFRGKGTSGEPGAESEPAAAKLLKKRLGRDYAINGRRSAAAQQPEVSAQVTHRADSP